MSKRYAGAICAQKRGSGVTRTEMAAIVISGVDNTDEATGAALNYARERWKDSFNHSVAVTEIEDR